MSCLAGVDVGDKLTDVATRRDASGQVERDAAQELDVAGQRRVWHAVLLHLREDVFVNEVAAWELARGGVGRKRAGDSVGQLGGVGRLRAVEQLAVNFGKLLRRKDLGPCLSGLLGLLGNCRQDETGQQNGEQKSLHSALLGKLR